MSNNYIGSSLFYNTSVRNERQSAIRVRHERQECNTSETRPTRVRHECDRSATRTTRVKNLQSDNDTSENIFSHHHISQMANERLQGGEQWHSKNYFLEMPPSHASFYQKN